MARLNVLRQDNFTGGLNLRADQFQLADNESPRMLNVEIDPRGGVFSRGAMRRINTAGVSSHWFPESLFPFYGDTHFVMLTTGHDSGTNGDVFYSTGGNFSQLSVPISNEHGASFAPWGSTLYMATGVGTVSYKWDGTTKTALTASGPTWQNSYQSPVGGYFPKANHATTHAGKVFVANTVENGVAQPDRIRWSHPNSPENWAEQDYIDIKDGATGITALAVFSGHLLVFKHNAVFAVFGYDSDTFQVVELSRTVGAGTSHSVCATERGVYFFSYPDGLMYYNGTSIVDIFEPIRPAITNGHINPSSIDEVYVNYINRRIWVSVPYSETSTYSYPTTTFVLDPSVSRNGAWLQFSTADSRGIAGGCTFISEDGTIRNLGVHATSPQVLQVDMYSTAYDNITGTDYQFPSKYRTRWLDAGSYSQQKMFRRPDVIVKQQTTDSSISIKAYGDYEEADNGEIKRYDIAIPGSAGGMIWGTSSWGSVWGAANTGSQIIAGRSIGLARSIQLEFVGPTGKPWGINSYSLKYNPRKVKA
jgi:hypothetical protein